MDEASGTRNQDTRVVVCPEDGTPEVLQVRVFNGLVVKDRHDPEGVECTRFEGPADCSKGCVG